MTRRFIVRRFAYCVAQLFSVIVLDYVLVRLMIQSWGVIPHYYEITPEVYEHLMRIRRYWEARLPLPYGFFLYFAEMFTFRFGEPFGELPIVQLLALHLPNTLLLIAAATIVTVTLGASMGILNRARRDAKLSRAMMGMGLVFYAVPAFVLGMALILSISFLFPHPTGILASPSASRNPLDNAVLIARKLVLAVITVGLVSYGGYAVLMQRNLVNRLGETRLLPGVVKGAEERVSLPHLARRSSTLLAATMVALTLSFFITAVVLTETVFNWSGLGRLLVDAVLQKNYPVIQAAFYVMALVLIVASFIVDLLRGFLDSRIRCD